MISARSLRRPSPNTAVLVRLAAFLTAAGSVILIPTVLAGAATGHGSVRHAFAMTAIAATVTLIAAIAARSLDPLRR